MPYIIASVSVVKMIHAVRGAHWLLSLCTQTPTLLRSNQAETFILNAVCTSVLHNHVLHLRQHPRHREVVLA